MKYLWPATALTVFFVIFTGLIFPGIVYIGGQALFPDQANGSLIRRADGSVLGSKILGQPFAEPKYFHPRPSAAGNGYDAANSSGTNLGPTSAKLIHGLPDDPATPGADESYAGVKALAAAYRQENGLAVDAQIPADAATRSASGLDPDISPANAKLQAKRVADSRGLAVQTVLSLIREHSQPRFIGIFGEPRVNVLELNLALDQMKR